MNEKRCANCKWHQHACGYYYCRMCENEQSDYCYDWTSDNFKCEKWEAEE